MNKRLTILTLLTFAIIITAGAQSPVLRLTLGECIDRAMTMSPAMRAGRLSVENARIMQGTAFDPEPTNVEFGQETTTGVSLDNGFNISQDFDFPTLYVARHKALKAETEVARTTLDVEAVNLAAEIESAYNAMLLKRKVYELRHHLDSALRAFQKVAQTRYENGENSRLEKLNARRLHESNHLQLDRAEADYAAACARMQALLGVSERVEPAEEALTVIPYAVPAQAIDYYSTPQGRLTESQLQLGKRNLSVARQGYLPGLSMGVTTQLVVKSFNPYHVDREPFEPGNFLGFTVGVKVPLFFGATRAKARAAQKEVEMLRELQQQSSLTLQADYNAAQSEYKVCRKSVDYYETTGLKHADEIERLSVVSYDLSEISYAEHIQNLETAIGIRIEYAQAVSDLNEAIIKLKTLEGR